MREAGRVARLVLAAMKAMVRAGATTAEVDEAGAKVMLQQGARSAPKLVYGFPGHSCVSVNDEIVHGIPGNRIIRAGDLVKLDVTVEKGGYMADTAATVCVGAVRPSARRLVRCAEQAFRSAMNVARAQVPLNEIGRAVEGEVTRQGYSVVRTLSGHGIGRTIHEAPCVPNYPDPDSKELLTDGLVITVEPIIAAGCGNEYVAPDGWTVKTSDHSLAAHYEHTIVITRGEPILLTA